MSDVVKVFLPTDYVKAGLSIEVLLTFTKSDISEPVIWLAGEKRLWVSKYGKKKASCDMEEGLFVVASLDMTVGDPDGELMGLLENLTVDNEGLMQVYLAGSADEYFEGTIRDDSIVLDRDTMTVSFEARSSSDRLRRYMVKDVDGGATNPFGYTFGTYLSLQTLIEDMFTIIDPEMVFDFDHDWTFYGARVDELDTYDNAPWSAVVADPAIFYDEPFSFGTNLLDILKNLGKHFFAMTGVSGNRFAFFRKLFTYDAGNVQTLGVVRSFKENFKYHRIKYAVGRSGITLFEEPAAANYTNIEGEYISVEIPDRAISLIRASDSMFFELVYCYDPALSPTTYEYTLVMCLKNWYHYRSDKQFCRVDRFVVDGVGYDFLKNFAHGGRLYQVLSMEEDIGSNSSVIEAIYVGDEA